MQHDQSSATRSRLGRRVIGFAVLAALLASTFLVAAPPAAAVGEPFFMGRPFTIVRRGDPYRVQVGAYTGTYHGIISIIVSQTKNPDGPTRGHRTAEWQHEAQFSIADDLRSGRLELTDGPGGSIASVDMRWKPGDRRSTICTNGKSHAGAFTGRFAFNTGDDVLGTITTEHLPGQAMIAGTGCGQDLACPPDGFTLYTTAGSTPAGPLSFQGTKEGGAATLEAIRGQGWRTDWALDQTVTARVPDSHVSLSHDSRTGMLKGAAGSFFSGRSAYSSRKDMEGDGYWRSCRNDKEWTAASNSGSFASGLTAAFLIGPDLTLAGKAAALRGKVRRA